MQSEDHKRLIGIALLSNRTTGLALFTAIVVTVRIRHVKGACGVAGAMAQAPPLTRRTHPTTMARYEDEPSDWPIQPAG